MKKLVGILFLATCMVVGFSLPATAVHPLTDNLTIEGQAGLFTEWTHQDEDLAGGESRTDLGIYPWDSIHFGPRYEGERVTWQMEVQLDDRGGGPPGKSSAWGTNPQVYMDTACAMVDFDAFKFRFGYYDALTFNPVGLPRGKYGNSGIGTTIGGTTKYNTTLIFPLDGYKFELLMGGPTTAYADMGNTSGQVTVTDTQRQIPAIEAAFTGFQPFYWKVFGGYQTYEATYTSPNVGETDIDSYEVGVVIRPSFGPAKANLLVNYSTNHYITEGSPWQIHPAFPSSAGAPLPYSWNWGPDSDTERLGITGSLRFDITQMFGVTFGGGYQKFEADGDYEDPAYGAWINFPINVTQHFRILPYIVMEDYDTVTSAGTEHEQGTSTSVGAFWRVTF